MKGGHYVHSKKDSQYQDERRRLSIPRYASKDPADQHKDINKDDPRKLH